MVKIRLRRVGATKRPSYRIVAADSRSPRDGRFLEILGHYNPLTEPATVEVKEDRIQYWVQHGAQPTDVVARLLSQRAALGTATAVAEPQIAVQEVAIETPAPATEAVSPTVEETTTEATTEPARPRRAPRRRTTAAEPTAEAERPRRTPRSRATAEQPESESKPEADEEGGQQESGDEA